MNVKEYIAANPSAYQEISSINKIFEPFNIAINEVIRCAQSVKYLLKLPLDFNIQGKLRRAEGNIKYTLSSAIKSNEYTYGHEADYVYIERPAKMQTVYFNDFNRNIFQNRNKLTLALGVDMNGQKVYTDLTRAPHILVGGTTGSGKSELLHAMIASLICGQPATGVEMLIIDPKRSEFSPYKNTKSIKLVTDMSDAVRYFEKAVDIMESRYQELERSGAKDIYRYNGTIDMHPIVIIIDELADLMSSHKDVEKHIVRIAQKARACGIHLIIGTQSPRKDVVTGLIKANVPTKIALKTTNQIESRIILDRCGAEKLLGKGDMLYLGNGAFETLRVQSAFVSEQLKQSLARSISVDRSSFNNLTTPKTSSVWDDPDFVKAVQWSHEYEAQKAAEKTAAQKQKRVGLFGGIANLFKVKPIMFESDDYPHKL